MKVVVTLAIVLSAVMAVGFGCNALAEPHDGPLLRGGAWVNLEYSTQKPDFTNRWALLAFFLPT